MPAQATDVGSGNAGPDRLGPVVCGVEDASHGRHAAGVAERLAAGLRTSLVLVHVAFPPVVPERPFATLPERTATRTAVERVGLLHVVLEPLEIGSAVAVERQVEFGEVADELLALADERRAALVVVGSRGHKAFGRALMGSTSSAIARRAPCPVVVVPPEAVPAAPPAAGLVCGVDGSSSARRAVRVAAWLAARLSASLLLVAVGDAEDGVLEDARGLVRELTPQVPAPLERADGRPADALLAVARESSAGLLVVGSRGRGEVRAALLGSVSTELMATADRPVVVVSDHCAGLS